MMVPSRRPSLLVADQRQFGYLTDTYSYCVLLRREFEITYICWDYGLPRVPLSDVQVIYVPRDGGRTVRLARYVAVLRRMLASGKFSVSFVVYFRGCLLLLGAADTRTTILDIRTGSVRRGTIARLVENLLLRIELRAFRNISIISTGLCKALGIDERECSIIPVGADPLALVPKDFTELRFLYVGTLLGRNIHETVEGFSRFRIDGESGVHATYDIVGDGPSEDKERLLEAINRSPVRDEITYHGRVPRTEVAPFFERCNVGVAYVPVTPWYQHQPVTKVFEYLLSGMPVIATRTKENERVIHDDNGILVDDTADDFARGLRVLATCRSRFVSEDIQRGQRSATWEAIVAQKVSPLLRRVAR